MPSAPRLRHDDLVLVADANKALVLNNDGTPDAIELSVVKVLEAPPNPTARELGADRPGRVQKAGARRAAVEETDFQREAESAFAGRVIGTLRSMSGRRVLVVAAPRFLADLREHYRKDDGFEVTGELDKDLTGLPVGEIAAVLGKA